MLFCLLGFNQVFNIFWVTYWSLSRHKLESAVTLGQNLIIDENIAIFNSAKHVLFGAIKWISDEILTESWSTDYFDLEQRNALFALWHESTLEVGSIKQSWGCFFIQSIHEADKEERWAHIDNLIVSKGVRLALVLHSHVGAQPYAQVLDFVAHRISIKPDLNLPATVALVLLYKHDRALHLLLTQLRWLAVATTTLVVSALVVRALSEWAISFAILVYIACGALRKLEAR